MYSYTYAFEHVYSMYTQTKILFFHTNTDFENSTFFSIENNRNWNF